MNRRTNTTPSRTFCNCSRRFARTGEEKNMAKPVNVVWHVIVTSLWLLVALAIAFAILYVLQQKQPIGIVQKGATFLSNAAKGKEVQ